MFWVEQFNSQRTARTKEKRGLWSWLFSWVFLRQKTLGTFCVLSTEGTKFKGGEGKRTQRTKSMGAKKKKGKNKFSVLKNPNESAQEERERERERERESSCLSKRRKILSPPISLSTPLNLFMQLLNRTHGLNLPLGQLTISSPLASVELFFLSQLFSSVSVFVFSMTRASHIDLFAQWINCHSAHKKMATNGGHFRLVPLT